MPNINVFNSNVRLECSLDLIRHCCCELPMCKKSSTVCCLQDYTFVCFVISKSDYRNPTPHWTLYWWQQYLECVLASLMVLMVFFLVLEQHVGMSSTQHREWQHGWGWSYDGSNVKVDLPSPFCGNDEKPFATWIKQFWIVNWLPNGRGPTLCKHKWTGMMSSGSHIRLVVPLGRSPLFRLSTRTLYLSLQPACGFSPRGPYKTSPLPSCVPGGDMPTRLLGVAICMLGDCYCVLEKKQKKDMFDGGIAHVRVEFSLYWCGSDVIRPPRYCECEKI